MVLSSNNLQKKHKGRKGGKKRRKEGEETLKKFSYMDLDKKEKKKKGRKRANRTNLLALKHSRKGFLFRLGKGRGGGSGAVSFLGQKKRGEWEFLFHPQERGETDETSGNRRAEGKGPKGCLPNAGPRRGEHGRLVKLSADGGEEWNSAVVVRGREKKKGEAGACRFPSKGWGKRMGSK